jgi:hypothetical protein
MRACALSYGSLHRAAPVQTGFVVGVKQSVIVPVQLIFDGEERNDIFDSGS